MKEEERKAFKSALDFVALFVVRHPHQQLFPFVYGNLFPFLLHHPNVIISFTKNTLRAQKKQVQWVKERKKRGGMAMSCWEHGSVRFWRMST